MLLAPRIKIAPGRIESTLRSMVMRQVPMTPGPVGIAEQVDHITPRSKGGSDDPDNLQSLCRRCHALKTLAEQKYS